jgi:hypothetical protein
MDAISPWILILLSLLAGAAAGGFALKLIDRKDDDELLDQVLDLAEVVIDTTKKAVQGAMQDVPIGEVEASATAVYRKYVAGTVLEKVMPERVFVNLVVEKWELLAGVEATAFEAMSLQRVVAGS